MDSSAPTIAEMVPLIITGGACLVGLGMIDRGSDSGGGSGRSTGVRWPTIALLFVASMAHVPVIPPHLAEAPYMGVLFIAFATAAFVLAALMAARPSAVLYPAAGLLCGAAILAFVATRLVAFPQLADDVGNWTEPLGVVSVAAEAGVVVLSTIGLRRSGLVDATRN